jgi:pyridoxal/pyridoxine/pyridoxamine kinase
MKVPEVWYWRAPLGKNKITKFLSKAAKNAGIEGNITNHSVRKTCTSRLMDAVIPANFVAQLRGHRNLKNLDSYKTASRIHQQKISNVLIRSSTSYQQNNDDIPMRNHIESQSSSSTISYLATKFNATAPVHSQVSGLFSGTSISKLYFQHPVCKKQQRL